MSIKAIDPMGVFVEYPQANRWAYDHTNDTIHLYSDTEIVAILPGDWIVTVIPFSQVDPGVEARE